MGKVFGYPEFDANGEKILTTYDNEYKDMMMDIRVYRMKAGETRSFKRDGEELAVLLLSGNITYAWDGNKETVSRKDVFTEGPWCVHVCTGTEVSVTAEADSEILVQCTKNDTEFAANYTNRRMLPGVIPARANSEMLPREESTPSLTMISLPGLTWFWVRFSMTEETGQDICLTDIRSRRLITLCSTVRKALVPALWVTRFSKAQTEAFQRSRVVNCIPRQWLPAFRCTPAG